MWSPTLPFPLPLLFYPNLTNFPSIFFFFFKLNMINPFPIFFCTIYLFFLLFKLLRTYLQPTFHQIFLSSNLLQSALSIPTNVYTHYYNIFFPLPISFIFPSLSCSTIPYISRSPIFTSRIIWSPSTKISASYDLVYFSLRSDFILCDSPLPHFAHRFPPSLLYVFPFHAIIISAPWSQNKLASPSYLHLSPTSLIHIIVCFPPFLTVAYLYFFYFPKNI